MINLKHRHICTLCNFGNGVKHSWEIILAQAFSTSQKTLNLAVLSIFKGIENIQGGGMEYWVLLDNLKYNPMEKIKMMAQSGRLTAANL